jgi:hypothetical protein
VRRQYACGCTRHRRTGLANPYDASTPEAGEVIFSAGDQQMVAAALHVPVHGLTWIDST